MIKSSILFRLAWFYFALVSVHLVFLRPYWQVIPGENSRIFSAVLCLTAFTSAIVVAERGKFRAKWREISISLILSALAFTSAYFSVTPVSSMARSFVLVCCCVGGFWCSRILLNTVSRQKAFAWLCSAALAGFLAVCLLGYALGGNITFFFGENPHALLSRMYLLAFGPVALITLRKVVPCITGALLLILAYIVSHLGSSPSVVEMGALMPIAMAFVATFVLVLRARSRVALLCLLFVVAVIASHYISNIPTKDHWSKERHYYRLESYPFALHGAKQRTWFGIGLRAPREHFVNDYTVRQPQYSKELFIQEIEYLETQENMFLTMLVGLGVPFFILYMFCLIIIVFRLGADCIRGPSGESEISPISLVVPLSAGIVYCTMTDVLMLAPCAWFFHILLGMAPTFDRQFFNSSVEMKRILRRLAPATATIVIGVVVGTHPFFAPHKLSIRNMMAQVKSLPIITDFVTKGSDGQDPANSSKTKHEDRNVTQPSKSYVPHETPQLGTLIVKIANYQGVKVDWGICAILDNSKSMSVEASPWKPNKLSAAISVVDKITGAMPTNSRLMLRSFYDEGPLHRKGKDLYLRVTKVMSGWTVAPFLLPGIDLARLISAGENNLCMAAASSLETDFRKDDPLFPRVLLLTDGSTECQLTDFLNKLRSKQFGWDAARLDIIAFGPKGMIAGHLQSAVLKTGGTLLEITDPQAISETVEHYSESLRKPVEQLLTIKRTDNIAFPTDVKLSEQLILQPGFYNITLPSIPGSTGGQRIIEQVKVAGHKTTVVEIPALEGGKPSITFLDSN